MSLGAISLHLFARDNDSATSTGSGEMRNPIFCLLIVLLGKRGTGELLCAIAQCTTSTLQTVVT